MKVVFKVADKRNVLTSEARDRAVQTVVTAEQKLSDIPKETDSDKRHLQKSQERSFSHISDTMSISYMLAPFPCLIFLILLQSCLTK